MAKQKDAPLLTLSVAASLLNMHPRTLMLYEKEGLVKPHRTSTNRRLFSETDLGKVQFIQFLIDKENTNLAGIRVILNILEKTSSKIPTIRKELFPDFSEKELI